MSVTTFATKAWFGDLREVSAAAREDLGSQRRQPGRGLMVQYAGIELRARSHPGLDGVACEVRAVQAAQRMADDDVRRPGVCRCEQGAVGR